jgi:NhaP-type Na+/H+ or K+/H+ antiporter
VLAAFAAGLAFNLVSSGSERRTEVSIDEVVNRFAVLPFFLALGAMLPWNEWGRLGWPVVLLALAVLVLRRLPVVFALMRPLRLGAPDAAYIGWFGPVGVSAVFYLTMEAERLGVKPDVLAAGTLVVVASTIAHGLTSAPGRAAYRLAARANAEGPHRHEAASGHPRADNAERS